MGSLIGLVASFAPQQVGRTSTEVNSLFDRVANMDLFAPVKTQNDYGARNKKKLSIGKISKTSSYAPNGMSAEQYNKIRNRDLMAKKRNYAKNVAKAGVFEDYTDWYLARGTDKNQGWAKSVTKGHRMAKTKYDWQDVRNGQGEGKKSFKSKKESKKDDAPKKAGFSF